MASSLLPGFNRPPIAAHSISRMLDTLLYSPNPSPTRTTRTPLPIKPTAHLVCSSWVSSACKLRQSCSPRVLVYVPKLYYLASSPSKGPRRMFPILLQFPFAPVNHLT